MTEILIPKTKKINETEEVTLPVVRCSVCGNPTTRGLHQVRLKLVRRGFLKKNDFGKYVKVPPVMKREDVYMCLHCVEEHKKWPGKKPT